MSKTKQDSNTELKVPAMLEQGEFHERLYQLIRAHIRLVLEAVMKQELSDFLKALPGERNEERRGHRNGYYQRDLVTGIGKLEDVAVPRDRAGNLKRRCLSSMPVMIVPSMPLLLRCFSKGSAQIKSPLSLKN